MDSGNRTIIAAVILLLSIHAAMLAHAATQHSPTKLEPAFLVAGLSHWHFGRFELFRVNPPLARMVAAMPVVVAGYEMDWSTYDNSRARQEFSLAASFTKANGRRSLWLITMARWACIPFSLIGGLFCFLWARELWGDDRAGLISLALWCCDPNVLAHAELITADCAATSFGVGAGYCFWRWLKHPTWSGTLLAGILLGLAELSKTSWTILFVLWPLLWTIQQISNRRADSVTESDALPVSFRGQLLQLSTMILTAICVVNFCYGFDGTCTSLKEFTFVSQTLSGSEDPGNRFKDSWLGSIPVPMPKQYVSGLDLQKRDFEDYPQSSYMLGEWKNGGWWYYYLYCVLVKVPHGTQLLLLVATLSLGRLVRLSGKSYISLAVLLLPALTLFAIVSSQLEFNHHFRYVLPAFGAAFVLIGGVQRIRWFPCRVFLGLCLVFSIVSMARNYPHHLAYFNELSGGPEQGAELLMGSNYDWGQDTAAEWQVYCQLRKRGAGRCVVLITEKKHELVVFYPEAARSLEPGIPLDSRRVWAVVVSKSALKSDSDERRTRYVEFVNQWKQTHNRGYKQFHPRPTILHLQSVE